MGGRSLREVRQLEGVQEMVVSRGAPGTCRLCEAVIPAVGELLGWARMYPVCLVCPGLGVFPPFE